MGQLDGNLLLWIQENIRTPIVTPFVEFVTSLGNNGWFWIALTILFLCFKQTRKLGYMSVAALVLSGLIDNVILKNIVGRIRPYEVVEGLKPLIAKPHDFSFPSGHTGTSFAVATTIFLNTPKKYGIWTMFLAALIGLSRLYVGVHYPTDVLAGLLIGIGIGFVVTYIFCKLPIEKCGK